MNEVKNSEQIETPSRSTNLEQPRFKPKATLWVAAGLLFVGLSSFVTMFIIHATLNNWW